MNLEFLEKSETLDFKDYLSRDWRLQPSYVWIRMTPESNEECLRVVHVENQKIILEKGKWLAPIPVRHRRNRNINLMTEYPEYADVYLPDGQKFLNVLRNRKETSDIVAWKSSKQTVSWSPGELDKANKLYIQHQKWKCRYCNNINQGSNVCSGVYFGQLPHGGPPKANNNVLAEYEYFLSKPTGCPPTMYPFPNEQHLGWHNTDSRTEFQNNIQALPTAMRACKAKRCVHFSHINQSDQILSFPRAQWTDWGKTYVTNTEQFYLPGAMLGHQTTSQEMICPKCRHESLPMVLTHSTKMRTRMEHSWWVIEVLYWLKVDIYNKKMQKLPMIEADARYEYLKNEINNLQKKDILDFVYYSSHGMSQSVPFQNILKMICLWISDKSKYDTRFERKKVPPGFNKVALRF